eukprot:symbB.v1.2.018366.t1/scaffold1422.1/size119683/3
MSSWAFSGLGGSAGSIPPSFAGTQRVSREILKDFFENSAGMMCLFGFIMSFCWLLADTNVVDETAIAGGTLTVFGLSLFNIGVRGLNHLGEELGKALLEKPKVANLSIFTLAFLCNMGEPALAILLEAAFTFVNYRNFPLIWVMIREPIPMLLAISLALAVAAVLGCTRLLLKRSTKRWLMIVLVVTLVVTTAAGNGGGSMYSAVGLAWDCAAVTAGPLTSPILLSLGLGMASPRSQVSDEEETGIPGIAFSGLGLVAFTSLFPVIAVWILALCFGGADALPRGYDYRVSAEIREMRKALRTRNRNPVVADIVLRGLQRSGLSVAPSCGCLFFLHCAFLESRDVAKIIISLATSFFGMTLFSIGLDIGLFQISSRASILLWSVKHIRHYAWLVLAFYGFMVGSLAAWCEPQLKLLGQMVDTISEGDIQKDRVILAAVLGVGCGSSLGVSLLLSGIDLVNVLIVGYGFCLVLSLLADEATVAIAWDVTALAVGPVTASVMVITCLILDPGNNGVQVRHFPGGFGLVSCCSLGALISVLLSGLLRSSGATRQRARTLTWTEMRSMPSAENAADTRS